MITVRPDFPRLAGKVWESTMVMVAYLAPQHQGEEANRIVHVHLSIAAEAIGFLMILHSLRAVATHFPPRSF